MNDDADTCEHLWSGGTQFGRENMVCLYCDEAFGYVRLASEAGVRSASSAQVGTPDAPR